MKKCFSTSNANRPRGWPTGQLRKSWTSFFGFLNLFPPLLFCHPLVRLIASPCIDRAPHRQFAAVLKSAQAQYLSPYEKKEILDYQAVYFIGSRSDKKQATPENTTNNYGYDDERGDYQVVSHDHLAFRYEVTDTLGKGSFGQVLSCRDHCTGQSVAVKIIRNKKRFHHQALVEIKILDNLRKWVCEYFCVAPSLTYQVLKDPDDKHNVIKMTEHFYFRGHLCIAMELLSINLYELIKANGFVGFTTSLIRRFTSQMLMSLSLMRHHRIVHCDLKPEVRCSPALTAFFV